MRVRRAGVEDTQAIAEVHVRSWRATYAGLLSPETLAAIDVTGREAVWLRRLSARGDGRTVLVACPDPDDRDGAGTVAGFLYLGPTPDEDDDPAVVAHVLAVHVDPPLTGRGVGGTLLRHALAHSTVIGYREATLWVVEGNAGARRFYARDRWAPDAARRREPLAVEGEPGEVVTVLRYRRGL